MPSQEGYGAKVAESGPRFRTCLVQTGAKPSPDSDIASLRKVKTRPQGATFGKVLVPCWGGSLGGGLGEMVLSSGYLLWPPGLGGPLRGESCVKEHSEARPQVYRDVNYLRQFRCQFTINSRQFGCFYGNSHAPRSGKTL